MSDQLLLTLKRREARRIKSGHPWVFANEVERVEPAGSVSGLCRVVDDSGRAMGRGYFNRHSLICARLLTSDVSETIDREFFVRRLQRARRQRRPWLRPGEAFRWVFGEADGLPGLVVDSYPGVIVVQVTTRGMEELATLWEEPLLLLSGGSRRVYRNDTPLRQREGLPSYIAYPDGCPEVFCDFEEAGAPAVGMPCQGQKTGFFLDQRENRIWLRTLAPGARVLDLYCYTGAWGISLLSAGAQSATFVDTSELALAGARRAAQRGGWLRHSDFHRLDTEAAVTMWRQAQQRFDLVCIDPPDLIPTRRSLGPGRRRLLQVFAGALDLVESGGHAVFGCCSYHLSREEFYKLLRDAGRRAGRTLAVVWSGTAAADHPRPVALPEADYLKCAVCRVD